MRSNNEKMKLSIIITVYSETISLVETVEKIIKLDRGYIYEIILTVSPKSSEECMRVCKKLEEKYSNIIYYTQKKHPGVGYAIREAMDLAKGSYIALVAGDLETEPEAVDRMITKIEETECDGVIGNRWLKDGGFRNYNRFKLILNYLFQQVFKVLFWTKLGDLTYGFKILSSDICKKISWEGTLHEIYIETTIKPIKAGYNIQQIPTIWISRKEGVSNNTFFKNFRYIKMAIKVLFSVKVRNKK